MQYLFWTPVFTGNKSCMLFVYSYLPSVPWYAGSVSALESLGFVYITEAITAQLTNVYAA